jgi:hypothetical protein
MRRYENVIGILTDALTIVIYLEFSSLQSHYHIVFLKDKINIFNNLNIKATEMLHIPSSGDGVSVYGFQLESPSIESSNHLKGSFPLGIQLINLLAHGLNAPKDEITRLKIFQGTHRSNASLILC